MKPNEYTLKIFRDNSGERSIRRTNILKTYSKYGIIPKIYVITKNYVVSKYIDGYTFNYIVDHFPKSIPNIQYKINNLKKVWYKLGFAHNDLAADNILVSKDLKSVYFIDPYIEYYDLGEPLN